MTKNLLRSLAIAALACTGATAVHAQTVLQLSYPANAPGPNPCLYTTNASGISADPLTGNLLAQGDFGTGCPQTGSALPLPVIVPGPSNWVLPNPWAIGQATNVQWAAVNAASCTYGGNSVAAWPSGSSACSSTAACQVLHDVTLVPPSAGQYIFSLTCNNATGGVTSTSQIRDVAANPPVINPGPSSWNVTPWEAGQTRSRSWSATNADNCNFSQNTLPVGVTLGQFLSGTATCNNLGACAANNGVTLTAPVAGTYSVTLNCSLSTGGSTTSTGTWNVTQSSSAGCLSPSGWSRLAQSEVYSVFGSVPGSDVTQFESIWGRNFSDPNGGFPITTLWPGIGQQLVIPKIGSGQYIAAKFHTPATGSPSHNFKDELSSYNASGGGNGNTAKISATVSTVCGDFDTASPNIPALCKWSQLVGGDTITIGSNFQSGNFCRLQPNTDYYLNLIYSPLTSPATATFNGVGGTGAYFQNQVFQ